jgi:ketosteroid isomerase-like protein
MRTAQFIGIGVVVFACACDSPNTALSDEERTTIAASVDSAMQTFQEAERSLDVERVIDHMAPDFYMYNDGVRVDYSSTTAQMRQFMTTLQHFEPGFANIEIKVLGRDGAVVSFTFRDSVVDGSGATMQFRGPTTMVWERRGLDWLITYVDADHYVEQLP